MTDKIRNLKAKINTLLGYFPVVIILGVRQCGKTTLAKRLLPDWRYIDPAVSLVDKAIETGTAEKRRTV